MFFVIAPFLDAGLPFADPASYGAIEGHNDEVRHAWLCAGSRTCHVEDLNLSLGQELSKLSGGVVLAHVKMQTGLFVFASEFERSFRAAA